VAWWRRTARGARTRIRTQQPPRERKRHVRPLVTPAHDAASVPLHHSLQSHFDQFSCILSKKYQVFLLHKFAQFKVFTISDPNMTFLAASNHFSLSYVVREKASYFLVKFWPKWICRRRRAIAPQPPRLHPRAPLQPPARLQRPARRYYRRQRHSGTLWSYCTTFALCTI
jgi:hypothetical protein